MTRASLSLCVSVCLCLCLCMSVCVCVRAGASKMAYMRWFSVNKTSGQLTLSHPLHHSTVSSVDLIIKATDDCWSGYWHWQMAGARHVTWTARDTSLLLVRVTVVMATRFTVTSLYAGVVTQAQAGHDVIKLAVCTSTWSVLVHHIAQDTDLHIYNLDAVPLVHVVSNHVDTDKLTTKNGGTFTSSSASRSSQSR